MIRKKKKFAWPRKLYNKTRILDENKLVEKYGLKNKKEIWKAEAKIKYFRDRAKFLITAESDEQKAFFNKLNKVGLKVTSIADILALNKEDLLKRRLTNVIVERGFANTPNEARQMVTHKRVFISNRAINSPSYLVDVDEEGKISVKKAHIKPKKEVEESKEAETVEVQE